MTALEQQKARVYAKILAMEEYELTELEGALKGEQPKDVTEFITKNCLNNGDGYYTPMTGTDPADIDCQLEEDSIHSEMASWLALPYGHICPHCGGSMLAVIQLNANGEVLKTDLVDCG